MYMKTPVCTKMRAVSFERGISMWPHEWVLGSGTERVRVTAHFSGDPSPVGKCLGSHPAMSVLS